MRIGKEKGVPISPELIGLFFEDINFAADGGLYAEMLENRSFEAREAYGNPGRFYAVDDPGYAWEPACQTGEEAPLMQYVTGTPVSEANPHYLRFTAKAAGQGFANKAYDGIRLEKEHTYRVSFYARCVAYDGTGFQIKIRKDGQIFARTEVNAVKPVPYVPFCDLKIPMEIGYGTLNPEIEHIHEMNQSDRCRRSEWIKYEAVLTAQDDVRGAQFVISLDAPGIVEFDLISMIPEDAVAGIFRKDLFEALQAIRPGFVRFPGGCIVEGISLANRYYWKNTVGDGKNRRYIPNLWAFDDDWDKHDPMTKRPDAHYGQSFGLGFYEYFLLCELLGAKPLPVLNIGTACQFRSTEMVDSDSPEFEAYVQDALDLIEFANGPVDSKWGALRAQMGHPESFHMDFLSVGNEQWETQYLDMKHRYERFEQAIHAKYPEIRLLGTAGPFMECSITEDAWKYYREKAKENPDFSYAVDEHYYVSPQWLYDHVAMYDEYPRNVAVFAGEYAAHTEDRANSMESALAEAALLTGIEKNADVVKLASYAPLFNRIGHSQWKPDIIWFDDSDVYLTPNYYVQKLFANHRGTYTIPLREQDVELRKEGIYVSAARDAQGGIILKAVNTNHREYELTLEDADGLAVTTAGQMWTLQGTGEMPEDRPEVSAVTEKQLEIHGSVTLPAESLVVIRYQ
ncbi:alpha-L-arabinofuranosidase C-terminal domain-containing protein [uncultured Eubacterium sp.]|uniref:alpha-L-arabinofuranosidase C-terminal domain-containing protein n=1 Tax=uncultured Eubacterium sp. TaxID=165185 RepID=UPI0025EB6F1B|nr:alpha-L-arabinofuranosidase C-terminal domain-containing protein [uncultured Eubacterium sp.]MCI6537461.1 alpha-L-arabinofuranosidase [Lachnospiraceae bacterium]